MQKISSLAEIATRYDCLLCDLWGVIHDGDDVYPGVLNALAKLADAGVSVYFLSNAPRLAETVAQRMDAMGVKREWYAGAMTSGEAANRWLKRNDDARFSGAYYYLGLQKDEAVLDGLPQRRVADLSQATWLLNGNFVALGESLPDAMPVLEQAIVTQIPMLCINPDLEVVKLNGQRIECAGAIAAEYERMGGKVQYIGKPHSLVYEEALAALPSTISKPRIAMVGDNLLTDIRGGNAAGLDTVLVTQGVLKAEGEQLMSRLQQSQTDQPTYILEGFTWKG